MCVSVCSLHLLSRCQLFNCLMSCSQPCLAGWLPTGPVSGFSSSPLPPPLYPSLLTSSDLLVLTLFFLRVNKHGTRTRQRYASGLHLSLSIHLSNSISLPISLPISNSFSISFSRLIFFPFFYLFLFLFLSFTLSFFLRTSWLSFVTCLCSSIILLNPFFLSLHSPFPINRRSWRCHCRCLPSRHFVIPSYTHTHIITCISQFTLHPLTHSQGEQ